MSLILDALKKSDKKRQDISSPRLDTVHDSPAQKSPRKSVWIYLLLVILLLNIGLLLWLLAPRKGPTEDPARAISSPPVEQASRRIAVSKPRSISEPQAAPPERKLPAVTRAQEESGSIEDQRIFLVSELPTGLQRRIPQLHMSLHAFSKSDRSASMVRINDQMMREGAQLDGNIRLETIRKDGAVMNIEGYRFLVPRRSVTEK